MKTIARWVLVIVIYMLLYIGADQGLWPLLRHFRHHDWQVPNWVDMGVSSGFLPFAIACLLASALRRELQESFPWPLLVAPLALMTLTKYIGDAFYPPYATEFLTLFAASIAQAVSVYAGWFLWHRFSGHGIHPYRAPRLPKNQHSIPG
jgi:hypothetical protein